MGMGRREVCSGHGDEGSMGGHGEEGMRWAQGGGYGQG